jgi:hypothetical protein
LEIHRFFLGTLYKEIDQKKSKKSISQKQNPSSASCKTRVYEVVLSQVFFLFFIGFPFLHPFRDASIGFVFLSGMFRSQFHVPMNKE